MKNNYCIYKYTNLINNKIYIGQTCQQLEKRAGKDGNGYKGCTYFYRAIKYYGWDNFKSEVIVSNLTEKEADIIEQEYIKQYNSNDPTYGYNLEGGGRYSKINVTRKTYFQDELMKYWRFPNKIAQYDLTGNILKIWKNIQTAANELHMPVSSITGCCSGRTKRAGKYIFKHIIDNKFEHKIDGLHMIGQYSLDGEFIKLWSLASEIEENTGIKSIRVNECCNNKRQRIGEYRFIKIYDSKNIPNSIEPIKKYKRFSKNGEYIDSFISRKEIAAKLGINIDGIGRCISGELKTSHGYIWRYE